MSNVPNGKVISRDTLVPIGAVVALIIAVLWISTRLEQMDARLSAIEKDARSSAEASQALIRSGEGWTKRDMRNWVKLLQARNPGIDVPELDE